MTFEVVASSARTVSHLMDIIKNKVEFEKKKRRKRIYTLESFDPFCHLWDQPTGKYISLSRRVRSFIESVLLVFSYMARSRCDGHLPRTTELTAPMMTYADWRCTEAFFANIIWSVFFTHHLVAIWVKVSVLYIAV